MSGLLDRILRRKTEPEETWADERMSAIASDKNKKKHIDELIARRESQETELRRIGDEIQKSGRKAAVVFIDLSDSTALKESRKPEVWLAFVYRFIRSIERLVRQGEGIVVKRIGDEVLATFESVSQCEKFVSALQKDEVLRDYDFKTAMDYGEVFFLKFGEHLEDDPYGPAVDRCARISKLAKPGVVICSVPYHDELVVTADRYIRLGPFKLSGITEPQEVYVQQQPDVDDVEQYLKPLLDALNDPKQNRPHYHSVARRFSPQDLDSYSTDKGRPFLLRELLNVPKLPQGIGKFLETLKNLEYEDETSQYLGYSVEWQGFLGSAELSVFRDHLSVMVHDSEDRFSDTIVLQMPLVMVDAVRSIEKGGKINFRGIIVQFLNSRIPVLDYVELDLPERLDEQA